MQNHTILGGEGVHLHLVESGNPRGRPILFLHGLSQCWLTWQRQLESDLADDYRLVAMDLRGHGLSEAPAGGYADSAVWAADVRAAIEGLQLDHPVLCGWSYGPLVTLDYVRHCGDGGLGGVVFVGGVTKLGSPAALSVLTPEFLGLVPGFFSTDVSESVRSLDGLLGLCFLRPLSPEERFLMLGYAVSVPPRVRQALLSRPLDNDDLLPTIRTPTLIVHGAEDRVVQPTVVEQHKAGIPQAQIHLMGNAGHAAFWDDAPAFNHRLRTFCQRL
jgi:pimeloyl-ACP methyl ester carboxylesterase